MQRFFAATLTLTALAAQHAANPPELGTVRFARDLDPALQRSRETGKPVFLLFQEIPGCDTCTGFGAEVLSHPLIVEAIEDLFVPVAIRNNVDGQERQTLERYEEPAWNNPVVRFLGSDGKDLIPRKDRVWTPHEILVRMTQALQKAGEDPPHWLVHWSSERADLARAEFAMHCFWEGQVALGTVQGVVATRAAFRDGLETVEVLYDPERVRYEDLVDAAVARACAGTVFTFDDHQAGIARQKVGARAKPATGPARAAPDSDQHVHLRRSAYRFLPMTRMQTEWVNAGITVGEPAKLLSPRQRATQQRIECLLAAAPKALDAFALRAADETLPGYHARLERALSAAERASPAREEPGK